ncbi:hypothetical protein BN7_2324 [Wickerhamomyces ciferrii]|uniref:MINDY deubiquitinase domain-containing protein n=1 Tax=Wickerhamomyces ciferrii (strain ATCC 14091 / BCRC 22168 / CBS 111 / JCM 3599 / NBRC 0793 / NRRL Y-1031 F-60-10) TaxID=1206466 RepID=K0KCJ6_WICCF|nr:uncharacterized protein BN7_2324 [Wickerhamomyces ciferrii]CCH42780.1 hypothetical protein BN7_2324 [Wickerhamomyces ciferrii]
MSEVVYKTKTIDFNGKRNILIQNENGPCALHSLVNSILLTVDHLSSSEIHDLVALVNSVESVPLDQLLNSLKQIVTANQRLYGISPEDIQSTLSLLPRLHEGLEINPQFDGTFSPGHELNLFRNFNIPLVHGWLVDPNELEYAGVLKYNSYEAAQNVLVEAYEVEQKPVKDNVDLEIIQDSRQIKSFFARSATQLTDYGLNYLKQNLTPGSIAVLFRNNHYATIIKNDNDIFSLVTDIGFSSRKSYIWESLLSINGSNNSFFTGSFSPILEDSTNPFDDQQDHTDLNSQEEQDRALARTIQEEEDNKAAKRLQQVQEKREKKNAAKNNGSLSGGKKSPKIKDGKKKSKCIVM